jgi:preprotein translocase subunit SecD
VEGQPEDDPKIVVEFSPDKKAEIQKIVKDQFSYLRLTQDEPTKLAFGLSNDHRTQIREHTVEQSIETIRNRIDQFGVSEPSIVSQGTSRIVVELPGVSDIERAKGLIGRTAKLEFKIVGDKEMPMDQVAELVDKIEKEQNITYKEGEDFSKFVEAINKAAVGKIKEGFEIGFERVEGINKKVLSRIPYLLTKTSEVTGDYLMDARVQFNPENNAPEVAFQFNPTGASKFGQLTEKNIRNRLAIVLDGIVYSAPVINSKISENGVITLGRSSGDVAVKEAKDLAVVLRAGALPAKLDFQEQRVVGAQLGDDSIKAGTKAGVMGVLLVFIFILFYYRVSGLIAVISLLINVLMVIASLVALEATLTLPGIAGIALTVGIAVDSNVVIFERIREELLSGKSVLSAVEAGFQKAFRTIMDANVTNAAAAIVLLNYGTGPIKGFAVTMLIGIIMTMFSAVYVCRVLFDYYTVRFEKNSPNSETNLQLSI